MNQLLECSMTTSEDSSSATSNHIVVEKRKLEFTPPVERNDGSSKQIRRNQSIYSKKSLRDFRILLNASIDCIRFLVKQGLAFRDVNEFGDSSIQGDFLPFLLFLADHNEDVKGVLNDVPQNVELDTDKLKKEIVSFAASETVSFIISDIGDALFSILIGDSHDISMEEQMVVVLRYVNKNGHIIERFLGIVHVTDITALSLKTSIDELFSRHGLSISRLRGQGYDGVSNMQGEFNSLKTLILKENESAFFVHCFAYELQLALVAVAKNHIHYSFFTLVANVMNVLGAPCNHRDIVREKQVAEVIEALEQCLNQSTSLNVSGDTHWGPNYDTLICLITMFSSVIGVLEIIEEDGSYSQERYEAYNLLESMQTFSFVFSIHLMRIVLGITNELSKALQRKDQDIVNAVSLVKVCKQRLQMMREDGWNSLLDQVSSFCERHEIDVPNMDDMFFTQGRPRRNAREVTNLHHYRDELFYKVIDMQLQELNNRFTKANTELLLCVACLCPDDAFFAFNKQKLIRLAQFYPEDFSIVKLMKLDAQLENYILDMRSSNNFEGLKGIAALAKKMVETKKDKVYSLVYLLLTLALILPVASATVERAFSAMHTVKKQLPNRMGDKWMKDNLVLDIEKDIFRSMSNEVIIQRFEI